MTETLTLDEAADLIRDAYADALGDRVDTSIDIRGVQAHYLKDGTLIIPGTNEFSDWFDFNLQFGAESPETHGFEVMPGDSGSLYHGGFLEHAQVVYTFAKGLRPKFVVGHSLGAASAQIVGASLGTPTVAFASPRTTKTATRLRGEGWVINVNRTDDTVAHVPPPFLGFRHMGSLYWMSPEEPNVGEDHRIDNYKDLLKLKRHRERIPQAWPA